MSAPVFLPAGELATPLANAGTESLDRWLLDVRGKLLRSEPVDLRTAPAGVSWVELDGTEDHQRRLRAACAAPRRSGLRPDHWDSRNPDGQRPFASQTPGAITVEAVDLQDLVAFARAFDLSTGRPGAPRQLRSERHAQCRCGRPREARSVLDARHRAQSANRRRGRRVVIRAHAVTPHRSRCSGRNC